MIVQDIIYSAFRRAGILRGPQRGLSPGELADGLAALNGLIDTWNLESLNILCTLRQVFNIRGGQSIYTIGPTGCDWTAPRPSFIPAAGLIIQDQGPLPLELGLQILSVQEWSWVPLKTVTSSLPTALYYDRSNTQLTWDTDDSSWDANTQTWDDPSTRGLAYLWPVPQVDNQIALYLWNVVSQFQSVTDQFNMAPGYLRALEFNLAVELAPMFSRFPINPLVVEEAANSRLKVKAMHTPMINLRADIGVLDPTRIWNWYTGGYGNGPGGYGGF